MKRQTLISFYLLLVMLAFFFCSCDNPGIEPSKHLNIVFSSDRDADSGFSNEIYVTNVEGDAIQRLTESDKYDSDPKWNNDGTKIVFTSYRENWFPNIYIMNSDGSDLRKLTDQPVGGYGPVFSPDNSKIVYTGFYRTQPAFSDLYIMNVDGTDQTRIGVGNKAEPAISPDGTRILYTDSPGGDSEIFVMNVDGSNQIVLTNTPGTDWMPEWSPDGNKIVFVSFRGNEKAIYTMNTDGSDQLKLWVSASDDFPRDPTYSPDGTKIIFGTRDFLQIMNVDGSGTVMLPFEGLNSGPDWY